MITNGILHVRFDDIMRPNKRPYELGPTEDANLVGMRLYGLGPFHRELKAGSKIQKKSHFIIRENDVIYNKLFAWKGTFGLVPAELDGMYVSDKFPTYEVDTDRVDRDYLRWYFRYPPLWEQARRMSTGSAALSKLTLNPPKFLELTMPLPALEEQRRISKKLAELAERHDEAKFICDSSSERYEAFFLSLMDRFFKSLEERWPSKCLIDLVDPVRGISYGVVQTGSVVDDGVLTLRAGDVQRFKVRLEGIKRISPQIAARYKRTLLQGTEVLLRIRGGLGEVAVCPEELIGGNVSREIAVIPVTKEVLTEYVMFAVARPSSQDFLQRHLRGTSYVGINLADVRQLKIPVPPKERQSEVLDCLRELKLQIAEAKEKHQRMSNELAMLLPSILDRAFRGGL
jgi:type I restriction enzyme, S subunit